MFQKEEFLERLIQECDFIRSKISSLKNLDSAILFNRSSPDSWNIVEVINHLLLVNEIYLEQIIEITSKQNADSFDQGKYAAGWIGRYLARNIRPKQNGSLIFRSDTFKRLNPQKLDSSSDSVASEIIDDYSAQLGLIQDQLKLASKVDLKKNKVRSAISNWFKLELGNAFDYMVGHNIRHLLQIQRILPDSVSLA